MSHEILLESKACGHPNRPTFVVNDRNDLAKISQFLSHNFVRGSPVDRGEEIHQDFVPNLTMINHTDETSPHSTGGALGVPNCVCT